MPWTMGDRSAFVALLRGLAPGENPVPVYNFVGEREAAVVDEAGAVPGVDQVRAGLLRALRGQKSKLLGEALEAATLALAAFPEQIVGAPPALMQRRHPAWVGLASLEAGLSMELAVTYAKAGFEAIAGPQGDGDVMWAMAEAAEDVGWTERHFDLLQRARKASFLDHEPRAQVILLHALHTIDSDPAAVQDLVSLTDDVDAPEQTRIHANWVLALRAKENGRNDESRMRLLAALALVDDDEDPQVAERLRSALT